MISLRDIINICNSIEKDASFIIYSGNNYKKEVYTYSEIFNADVDFLNVFIFDIQRKGIKINFLCREGVV